MNIVLLVVLLLLIPILFLLKRTKPSKRLPPGSLGVPIIGQSLALLRTMRSNTAEKWVEDRIKRYGPISKLSLFGTPTVFIYGQAANKLIFGNGGDAIVNQQTKSIRMILGDRNLLELSGKDHSRVRGAIVSLLKPESLKQYVGKIDEEVRTHLHMHWEGKQQVKVLPLMKTLTFNIICSILFGVESGKQRDQFLNHFKALMKGMWAVPINAPFTHYNRSLRASARIQSMLEELVQQKKIEHQKNGAYSRKDLISGMLNMVEDGKQVVTEKEIIHNAMFVMVAGHDSSSILLTFFIRVLANEPTICATVLQEQQEIAKSKLLGEPLTWEDLSKMKYTWRVAMETLRRFSPIFGGFRKAAADIEYGGYIIPKGWQIFWVSSMTHMDDNIFPEPTKFDPSRFENQTSTPPYSFVAFGGGARICPGYELARVETLVAIHYLVTKFSWKQLSDNLFSRDPLPTPTQGLLIELCSRKPSY